MKRRAHASCAAALLLAACSVPPRPMYVELDVFSGRPNPRWQMTAEEIRALTQALSGLSESPATAEGEPGGLEFRGFIITEEGSSRQVRVHSSRVDITDGGRTRTYGGAQRVQDLLAAQAGERGYRGLVAEH